MTEDRPRIWIQKNYASFNGIRGLAVALVFCAHFLWIMPLKQLVLLKEFGFVGVDLFFVLSGFLITGILYDSLDGPRYFRDFYIRRTLRIFPLFYGLYLLIFLLKPLLHLTTDRSMPAFMLYVGNLLPARFMESGPPNNVWMVVHGRRLAVMSLAHFWSLCVEEQFYLVWPAVVWWVRDRRKLMWVCACGALFALLLRIALRLKYSSDAGFLYSATYTRFDTLLVGAWTALFLRGTQLTRAQLYRWSRWLMLLPGALLLGGGMRGFAIYHFIESPFTQTIGYTLIALAATGLLLRSLDDASRLSSFLRLRLLARLGVVSYGFYVIHDMPGYLLNQVAFGSNGFLWTHSVRLVVPLAWFVVAWLLAEVSFRYYEEPFLRLKSKLAPQRKHIHLDLAEPPVNAAH